MTEKKTKAAKKEPTVSEMLSDLGSKVQNLEDVLTDVENNLFDFREGSTANGSYPLDDALGSLGNVEVDNLAKEVKAVIKKLEVVQKQQDELKASV